MWPELFSENISIALNAFIRLQKSRSKKYYNNHPSINQLQEEIGQDIKQLF